MPWGRNRRSPFYNKNETVIENREESFQDDPHPPLAYNRVFPDFTIDQINEMNSLASDRMKDEKGKGFGSDSGSTTRLSSNVSSLGTRMSSSQNSSSIQSPSERKNIWSLMTRRNKNGFDFDDDEQEALMYLNRVDKIKAVVNGFLLEAKHCFRTLYKYPYIYIYSLLVFAGLTAAGLIVVEMICSRSKLANLNDARWEAMESASDFAEVFTKSLIPLRSLQQAVVHSEYFKYLPREIGNYGAPGSAEAIYGGSTKVKDYRNVTGICDNPEMFAHFHSIVESINRNFGFEGIIVNYRLAPYGVFCAVDPIVNTEDFDIEYPMNSTAVIGWDPLNSDDERWKQVMRHIYSEQNTLDIYGPMIMHNAELFCAHLSVPFPGYNLTVDGKEISTWGFVMHFIHWERLKEQFQIDERFREKNYFYRLTRTDEMMDPDTGMVQEHVVTIAQNLDDPHHIPHGDDDHHLLDHKETSVSVNVMTPNGEWVMTVSYFCELEHTFLWVRIITVLCTFIVSAMFALVLLERQLHKLLLYKIMPKDAIEKLNRGHTVVERYNIVTIFFSDIVGFTSLAGEMTPIQVMKMLNELYLQFDRIVEKHGVYKVETIGDAYMVVGGAPDRIPAPKAAQNVTLFALEAIEFVKNFRTSDGDRIYIRAGIASGPVVAGVVGRAMPRYCFFGDTVNLASRMESNSKKMRIQCSDFTHHLLKDAPDFNFDLKGRVENGVSGINVKGKGITQTWWINSVTGLNMKTSLSSKRNLLSALKPYSVPDSVIQSIALSKQSWVRIGLPDSALVVETSDRNIMVNRVTAILEHRLSIVTASRGQKPLKPAARKELRKYVADIASLYNNVHFHNFEHAVHVTMSMNKMIDTIVESVQDGKLGNGSICRDMCQNSSLHFAMIFSSLIHDVEHTGCSNKILVAGNHNISKRFTGPSAERNSIQVAIELLFKPKFKNFRKALFPDLSTKFEFGRCVFWAILCTDIATPERLLNGRERYNIVHTVRESIDNAEAELSGSHSYEPGLCPLLPYLKEIVDYLKISDDECKAHPEELCINQAGLENCVTVEHMMQISDVAHLTQSWEVFLKYNFRLYKELMACHARGLMPDPSSDWSIGQIGFMTNYVIPLTLRFEVISGSDAASLTLSKNCMANLDRWESEGDVITEIFVTGHKNNSPESEILIHCFEIGGQIESC